MKIGEIEVGKEYAALDNPQAKYGRKLIRHVEALEIVSEKEMYWPSSFAMVRKERTVRKVKVKFLDSPRSSSYYRWDVVTKGQKGSTAVVETRKIVCPWDEVRDSVEAQRSAEEAKAAADKALADRVRPLLKGVKSDRGFVSVSAITSYDGKNGYQARITLEGAHAERLLSLAEKGLAK